MATALLLLSGCSQEQEGEIKRLAMPVASTKEAPLIHDLWMWSWLAAMITGVALVEVLRPRRSKLLPRHFVLAVTENEVVAFKATGGSGEDSSSIYEVSIREGIQARFPRASVSISDIPEGEKSKGGIMTIDGESFPVARPNLNGDPNTDELIAVLAPSPLDPQSANR